MADRPRSDGPQDGPEFGWLYGKRPSNPEETRPVARGPRPEETRMLPTQPRAQSPRPPAASPQRPVPPPLAPTPAPTPGTSYRSGGGLGRRGRGGRHWYRPRPRWILLLLLAWVAYLVLVPIFAWRSVDKVAFEPEGARPDTQPGTTYLMVGSDSRAGLSAGERKALGTGNAAGGRTDSILLLHTGSGPNLLMSIPRDSIVDIPGRGPGNKINAAYAYGGARLLVRTIEENTGIRVDDYVETGFGGVVDAVDAVGGVDICPTTAMKDPLANLDIQKGCQEADGTVALGYARSRHTDPRYGDITRAKHQREVISAVFGKAFSPWTFVNPLRYWNLNHAVPNAVAFGDGMSPIRVAMWALALKSVNGNSGLTCGVPIADLSVRWDPERSKQMFDYIIGDNTDQIPASLCTPTGLSKAVTG